MVGLVGLAVDVPVEDGLVGLVGLVTVTGAIVVTGGAGGCVGTPVSILEFIKIIY